MFELLTKYGNMDLAIKFAQKLELIYTSEKDFANHNPCTTVYKLVAELFNLEKTLARESLTE